MQCMQCSCSAHAVYAVPMQGLCSVCSAHAVPACSTHAVCARLLGAGGRSVHEPLGTAGHATSERQRPRAFALRGGGGIRVAAGGEAFGWAPGAIVSKRLRPLAARHLGVSNAAESATSAGPHGRTAAAHAALGCSAARPECVALRRWRHQGPRSIRPRRAGPRAVVLPGRCGQRAEAFSARCVTQAYQEAFLRK